LPVAVLPGRRAAGRDLTAVDRRPDADRAVLRRELRDRHLDAEREHAVGGEEFLVSANFAGALVDRDEVEGRPDVAEERVVALTGELPGGAAVERGDRL